MKKKTEPEDLPLCVHMGCDHSTENKCDSTCKLKTGIFQANKYVFKFAVNRPGYTDQVTEAQVVTIKVWAHSVGRAYVGAEKFCRKQGYLNIYCLSHL